MVSWKQFCFSDGEAIRQEGGAGRTGGTAKSARRSGRPPAGNPYGPGEFGPNPSAFGLGRTTGTTAPKASTPGSGLWPARGQAKARIPSGRTLPSNHERL
jgi:hypothetical protein